MIEQAIHTSNSKIKSIRGQLDASQVHANGLRDKLAECEAAKEGLEREISNAKLNSNSTREEIGSLNLKVQSLVSEKMQLLERIDSKNTETKDLQSELDTLRRAGVATRKSVIELEGQAQQHRSYQISANLRQKNLEQEMSLLKKSNEWLQSELDAKSTDFSTFRTEKLNLIATLQTDLAMIQSSYRTLEKSHDGLKERYTETAKKLDESLVRVKDLKDSQTANEEAFRVEMASQKRLAELWERSTTDAKDRIQELQSVVESERLQGIEEISHWRLEAEREASKVTKLERQLANLETQLETSFVGADVSSSTPFSPFGSPNKSAMFSPSAQIISEIQKGGGSLVQLYSDFKETKTRLEREKVKNQNLRDQMTSILEEMESHAPAILAEREENVRLESELAELSMQLETATSNCEEFQGKLKTSEIRADDNARESKILQKQVSDLSRQIQHLLIQNQLNSDTSSPLMPDEHSALQRLLKGEDPTESDTDRLISQRLVLFTNIVELQRQNENLLKITRQLGAKMEKEEAAARKKMEEVESDVVTEAKEAIETLQTEVETLNTKLSALQRERDMFRRILSNKSENGMSLDQAADASPEGIANQHAQQLIKQNEELNASFKEAQSQLDQLKTDKSETVKEYDNQISALMSERSTLQVQVAKAESHLQLSNERFKNLEGNFNSLQTEHEDAKKRINTLQESLQQQQIRTQQVTEDISATNSLLESLRNESANLKAEKMLWKSIEERLNKENSDLIEERGRLNGLLATAQSVEAGRVASAAEIQQRLTAQITTFQADISTLRTKLDNESQEIRSISQLKDTQAKEYQERIDRLSNELHTSREALMQTREERHQIDLKSREIQLELRTTQDTLSLLRLSQSSTSEGSMMAEEVTSLKKSLALSNSELDIARDHINELRAVSAHAEESLQNMMQDYDSYKKDMDESFSNKEVSVYNSTFRVELTILERAS